MRRGSLALWGILIVTTIISSFGLCPFALFAVEGRFRHSQRPIMHLTFDCSSEATQSVGEVAVLSKGEHHLVIDKPPSVVCHHSDWTGSLKKGEIPMLQRCRAAFGQRVNLVHRLDRGCSGCLLMTYTDGQSNATSTIIEAMAGDVAQKTYLALVRGEGILRGEDLKKKGWFLVDRPIKNECGVEKEAQTWFRFVAGQGNDGGRFPDIPRASIVLARPKTGRWHQIRRHLNGLSHPILGDSSHGNAKTNQEWKAKWGLIPERTCLHLLALDIPAVEGVIPDGLHVTSELAPDMMQMLEEVLPNVMAEALPILKSEALTLRGGTMRELVRYDLKHKVIGTGET